MWDFIPMQAYHRDGIRHVMPKMLLAFRDRCDYTLFNLDFLLQQVLNLFNIVDVLLIELKSRAILAITLCLNLFDQVCLICQALLLTRLLDILLVLPVLLVHLLIDLQLCVVLTSLDL